MTEQVRFNASEIYQFAIRIEENGETFYRKTAASTPDARLKELFGFLAGEEAKHRRTFETILAGIADYRPPEIFPDEYFLYLRSYADTVIFSASVAREMPEKPEPAAAVDFAIRRELDSILYYLEIRNIVPDGQKPAIDRIVEQERRHFTQLTDLKRLMAQGGTHG